MLIISRRFNLMARDISSWELTCKQCRDRRARYQHMEHKVKQLTEVDGSYSDRIKRMQAEIDNAEEIGHRLGYKVVVVHFDRTTWPCEGINKVLGAAAGLGWIPRAHHQCHAEVHVHTA